LLGIAGALYVAGVATLGAAFVWYAWKVLRSSEGGAERRACRHMFSFSIAWLFGVFALILIERMAGLPPFHSIVG
jgi:protoheme IX farnesyltransferase